MKLLLILFLLILSCIYILSCKNEPYKPNFETAGGYVIGKEKCNTDTAQDFWLIDLSIFPLLNSYGDSLILNGITYKHVVKTTDLAPQFKNLGAKVGFDFHLSQSLIQSANCSISSPVTYSLKQMSVLNQGEVR